MLISLEDRLDMSHCQFQGSLPSDIGLMTMLGETLVTGVGSTPSCG